MSASVFASVVFLKVQEFARRPVSEQARLRAQLEAVVAITTADIEPAGRIVLDASDGAAIVVLHDPAGAVPAFQPQFARFKPRTEPDPKKAELVPVVPVEHLGQARSAEGAVRAKKSMATASTPISAKRSASSL